MPKVDGRYMIATEYRSFVHQLRRLEPVQVRFWVHPERGGAVEREDGQDQEIWLAGPPYFLSTKTW